MQISKKTLHYFGLICKVKKSLQMYIPGVPYNCYTTTVDVIDTFTNELERRQRYQITSPSIKNDLNVRYFMEIDNTQNDVSKMTTEDLDDALLQLLSKNRDKQIAQIISDCYDKRKVINENTLKKLLRHYSVSGKPEAVASLLKYCAKVYPTWHKRNGEFQHYLAKAQCFKGNSDKGLSIIKEAYKNHERLRSFYRIILKELIQDSVLNRSEASLVVFKKYVLEFSQKWNDHYPLVCFWHICWSSSWFSDQMFANELLESSETLQDIVWDKSIAFSISILRQEYNEDAVMRLLQMLLKYEVMSEYAKVLQVLFNYKLRNKDIRGCTEIIRHCEVIGISLPANQQGKYIKMLIHGKEPTAKTNTKNFKLKF